MSTTTLLRGGGIATPKISATPLFELGTCRATEAAWRIQRRLAISFPNLLHRHRHGDFGKVSQRDYDANRAAIRNGEPVISVFEAGGERLFVRTNAERTLTTIFLPEEA